MSDEHDENEHAEMVQNWVDECAANGWDLNGVPLNSNSKPSPWVETPSLGFGPIPKNRSKDRERLSHLACAVDFTDPKEAK